MESQNQNDSPATQTLVADPERTKMVQPERTVKVKILREVSDPRSPDKLNPPILMPGDVVELPLEMARALVKRRANGMYEFSGHRESLEPIGTIKFAEKWTEPKPKDEVDQYLE